MKGLNKKFISDPFIFLRTKLIVTREGPDCPTCHRPLLLAAGGGGWARKYVRPETKTFAFDLIGDKYLGPITANHTLMDMLDGDPGAGIPAQGRPRGLKYEDCNYAALWPMGMGAARQARKIGKYTHRINAYWLPWSHLGVEEHQLTNQNVDFFFTAMFSGCTFTVATPTGADPGKNVWVAHIAWDPGPNFIAAWGGGAAAGADADARRLVHEAEFYRRHLDLNRPVRSVTSSNDPLVAALPGCAGGGLATTPIVDGTVEPRLDNNRVRLTYGDNGAAFIIGWRDEDKKWCFAVQQQPSAEGSPMDVPYGQVNVIAAHRFY